MDIVQLQYFQHVAHTQNTSKSAESLHISQSAISHAIKKLEEELDCSLFDRVGNQILLNENGKVLVSQIDSILAKLIEVKTNMQLFTGHKKKIITIATDSSSFVSECIVSYNANRPDIGFCIVNTRFNYSSLPSYDLFVPEPQTNTDSEIYRNNYNKLVLPPQDHYIVLPKDHPAAKDEIVNLHQLGDCNWAFCMYKDNRYERIYYLLRQLGIHPKIKCVTNDPMVKSKFVSVGNAIGVYYKNNIWMFENNENVVLRPFFPSMPLKVHTILWSKDSELTPWVVDFLEFIRKNVL